ncbi:MAG: helix-turn-helix transcriptional regulator [Bacilli bacterium]|nr:helix-turn-helix transcriptional regulator [Bacilli bacterium]
MIKVGKNIKKLREKKGLTQEKLANFLGVTPQAISRWENETGYPDIELLPLIANFFDVTIDELLDREIEKNKLEIQEGIKEIDRLNSIGEKKKRKELIIKLYNKYPYNFNIINYYIWLLTYDEKNINFDEIEKLCLLILEECNDEQIRYSAIECLSNYYSVKGDEKKALKILKKLPLDYRNTFAEAREYFYGEYDVDGIIYRKQNIETLTDMLCWKIMVSAGLRAKSIDNYEISIENSIKLYNKAIQIFKIVYEEEDYLFYNARLEICEWELYRLYKKLGNLEESNIHLKEAIKYAKAFDNLNEYEEHRSILVEGNEYNFGNTSRGDSLTHLEKINELLKK